MAGERPLRKTFSYRDLEGSPLEDHTEHWRGFEWDAGPVCVIHKGGRWGVPQVWAISAAEGKRVIRHAAAIAGIDCDQEGRWVVTGTLDPRYGKTGKMLVKGLRDGAIAVTKREGPNGLPQVVVPDP
jgi:hypothetical protein